MEWLGISLDVLSEAAIIAGAAIMLAATRYIRNISRLAYTHSHQWKPMSAVAFLLLLGYILDLIQIAYGRPREASIVTDLIFISCGIFVYLSLSRSAATLSDLDRHKSSLETATSARQQLEDVLTQNKQRLLRQNEALLYLTKRVLKKDTLEESLRLLTEKTAEILEVDRVSIWLFDSERTYLSCLDLYEQSLDTHSHGTRLYKKDYPIYFDALENQGMIDAPDALSDGRTIEYTDSYLKPLGITSLLDVPIHSESRLTGVLCNETIGPSRRWTIEEQSFAAAVTDIVIITIETFGRKSITEQLTLSESTFRNAFEYSGIGMALVSPEGKWMKVNKELCGIVGYSTEELLAKTFQDITHPDDLNADLKLVQETLSGERDTYKMEKRYFHKGGSIIWVNLTVSLVRDKNDAPLFFISQIEDITERKKIQRSLEVALSLTKATIESTQNGVLVIDSDGKITDYNQQFIELLRVPEQVMATADRKVLLKYIQTQVLDPAGFEKRIEDIYTRPADDSQDIIYFTDGRIYERYSKPQMIKDEIVGRVWTYRDITQQKLAESVINKLNADLEDRVMQRTQEVNKLNEELKFNIQNLEVANKELESFSYSVSHDLRAPLRIINGFVGLLEERNATMDDESKHFLQTISNNAQKMAHLIEDLLSFSRMGKKELIKTELDMNKLLQDVLSSINIKEWNSHTQLTVGDMLPASGDDILIKQVFFNLIWNAVKYSRTKENPLIEVGSYAGENENTYYVKDNGVGFSMEYYDKLFKAFQRMHSSEEFEGTGVGLAIVHRIVTRHGGRVWAEAMKDKGASFYFTLPVSKQASWPGPHQE